MVPPDPRLALTLSGPVARLCLNRPDKRNAIDQRMWEAIPVLMNEALAAPGTRCIVVQSATAGIFCAGADIGEFAVASSEPAWRAANQAAIRAAQLAIARCPVPTVSVIDGDCVGGGCGLAIACDLRVVSPRARLGITPAKLGLVYSLHDTRLLVDLIGPARAKRMLFTGQLIDAATALAIGLVDEVADDPAAAESALLDAILAAAPSSQRGIKAMVRRILDGQTDDDAATARAFDAAFQGADFAEGVGAFLARRPARFGA